MTSAMLTAAEIHAALAAVPCAESIKILAAVEAGDALEAKRLAYLALGWPAGPFLVASLIRRRVTGR